MRKSRRVCFREEARREPPKDAATAVAVLVFLLPLSAASVLYFHDPRKILWVPCLFRAVTGLDCPLCGMTRAAYCLLHLRFAEAFRYHPFIFAAVPLLALLWEELLSLLLRGQSHFGRMRTLRPALAVLLAALAVFSVGRDIPGCPLSYFRV